MEDLLELEEIVIKAISSTDGTTRGVCSYLSGYLEGKKPIYATTLLNMILDKTFCHDLEHDDNIMTKTMKACLK